MSFPCLKARCYDAFGVTTTLVSVIVVLPCFSLATPVFAIPVLSHTLLKVAYHSSRFFLARSRATVFDETRQFTAKDLKLLQQEEKKLCHKSRMNASLEKMRTWLWGLIPGYGAWKIIAALNGPTKLVKDPLESDLRRIRCTIQKIRSASGSSATIGTA